MSLFQRHDLIWIEILAPTMSNIEIVKENIVERVAKFGQVSLATVIFIGRIHLGRIKGVGTLS